MAGEAWLNLCDMIEKHAELRADEIALVAPRKSWLNYINPFHQKYEYLSFYELHSRIQLYAKTMVAEGISAGDRVLVFIPPSFHFSSIVFALFKIAAVPVLIDPGMGVDNLLNCIEKVKAKYLIGIAKIHHLKAFKSRYFKSIEKSFVIDGRALNAISFEKRSLQVSSHPDIQSVSVNPQQLGAILFTSGGTGTPKGVLYTQEIFYRQALKLKQMFELNPMEIDYPCFPLFSLFTLSLGMKNCIPNLDASAPAQCDGKTLVKEMISHQVTFAAGSPAIFMKVADYCERKKITLPSLRCLIVFGAPVSVSLHQRFQKILPHGKLYTPYGATECLPVSCISSTTILQETASLTQKGLGVCVGYPAPNVQIQILADAEIAVKSDTVTLGYFENEEASCKVRFKDQQGQTWHKMGDVGKLDEYGRLWFYGRKNHCFELNHQLYYSAQVEAIFNEHPAVFRSALVKLSDRPAVVIERVDHLTDLPAGEWEDFLAELLNIAKDHNHTKAIKDFFLHPSFPVDARHNIKIDREKLSEWAQSQ